MKFKQVSVFSTLWLLVMATAGYGGALTGVTATPGNSSAGASTIYTITLTTDATTGSIPADGKILITFQAGFDVSGVSVASSNDANMTGGFSSISSAGQTLTLTRDGTGNMVGAGVAVSLNIANVTNTTAIGSFTVEVETQTAGNVNIDGPTTSGSFSIAAGPLSKIVIEDAAGGSGTEITTISTTTDDDAQQFFAVGRDEFDNFVSDVSVTWGVTNGIGSVSPTSGTSTTLTLTTPATGRVTADDGAGHGDATGDITVTVGALNSLIVRDATGGLGSPVDARTLTTSDNLTLFAAGYDADSNYIGDRLSTWSSTGTLSPSVTDNNVSTITFSPDATGSGTISADAGGGATDATGTITVNAGVVSSITIKDAPNNGGSAVGALSLTTDDVRTFYAAGFDADATYIGDVTVTWAVTGSLDAVSPTSGSSTVFDPSTPVTSGTVTATHVLASDATGTIDVAIGSLAKVIIRDTAGGAGAPVDDRTMTTDQALTVHAAGYDADDNFIADQASATWSSSGLTPAVSGTASSRTFSPTTTGSGFISADVGGISDATGTITVNAGAVASIIIRDGANGSGSEVTTRTLTTDESLTLYAAGYDGESNFVRDINATWGQTGTLDNVAAGPSTSVTFSPATAPTSGTITADSSTFSDATGTITVNPGALSTLTIRDAANNGGAIVVNRTLTTDQTLDLFAAGSDAKNNYIGDIVSDWTVSGGIGAVSPATGANTVFDAQTTGSGSVTATAVSNGAISDGTGTITVNGGNVASFSISNITNQTAGNAFSITITALDADGQTATNFTGTVTISDLTGSITPTTSGVFSAGQRTETVTITTSMVDDQITVSDNGLSGVSNLFTVNADVLDHFSFDNITSPKTAGSAFSITITAQDANDNTVTGFTSTVSLSVNKGSIVPTVSGSFTAGVRTESVTINASNTDVIITATNGSITGDSNPFNVNPGALSKFAIDPISDQATNTPFLITVTAQDANDNTVTSFTSTVDISDGSGSITPTVSGSFSDGKWSGTATVSTATIGNTITVTRTGGTETGTSNAFDVTSTTVDHFTIAAITSPQTAGTPFNITITAEDASNNTVTGFTGTVNLSDLTGTISPTLTSNFSGGVLSNFSVTITKSMTANVITATGVGKSGASNSFDVDAAALDHFAFSDIPSPQVAGTPFSLTITALDQFENVVDSFSSNVTLSDNSGTISPTSFGPLVNGQQTANVTITKTSIDNQITATFGSVSSNSNVFNVNSGALTKFVIDPISDQATNTPFLITVTAQDQNNNTVTSFTSTVDISDGSGSITPTVSGNFSDGKWSGTVTVSTATTGNTITVTRTGGTETGTSNAFDVTSTTVDHFTITNISSPQTAGTPFNITITAEDASNNTVTGFAGTVKLSDLTGTISPILTGSFSGGVLSNFSVTITRSMTANVITATGVGKAGASNAFDVDAAALDHFAFSDIPSPQVAGTPFSLTITALDTFENTVESFTDSLTLSDVTGTISPARFGPFTNGQLTGNVTITRKTVGDKITATFNAVTSSSSVFNVDPGALDHLLIRDAAGGLGVEVGDRGLTLDERLTLYAAGYDVFGNYIREVTATWDTTGTLDLPSPVIGTSTTFDPIKPSSGMITADTADVNVQGDSTGLITVGSIAKIIIRDAANGLGNVVSDRQITADDSLSLFAAGYDAGNQFIGDVAVDWFSGGNLTPAINQLVVSSVTFRPTLAPASGKIFADHVTAADDSTGTITVVPGIPVGTVTLTPVPAALAADGTSQSTITSATIVDGDSNAVGVNTLFLVTLSDNNLGTIVTPDADPGTPGHQIATNASSQLSFEFKAGTTGGTVIISVFSGNASGNTAIAIGSMAIESIETDPTTVSQGQRNIEVRLVVDNLSISTITNLDASLSFANAGAVDRTGQYSQVRTDPFTDIPGGGKRTLTFDVTVQPSASLETITIDGTVNGKIGAADVSAQGALTTDSWAVQSVAELKAVSVTSSETLVTVGQPGIGVSVVVQNNPGFTTTATALIDSLKLRFLKDGSVDKSSDFPFQPDVGNPDSITGGDQATFNFTVTVGSTADTGHYEIDVQVFGRDANSDSSISDLNADSRHAWTVQGAPTLQILSLTPTPKSTFFANQTDDWTVKMAVKNNGPDPIDIDFSPANTFIKFIIGSDRTPQYTIVYPTSLAGGGIRLNSGARDTLNFVIDVTGATIGTATITGRVQGTDVGTSNTIFDDTNDSGTGVVNIISPNRTIFIAQTNPETSNSSQGIGIVDTSQAFKISVNVKNDLGEAVENVVVQLTSNGFSTVVVNPDTIPVIASGASVTKMFDVIASSTRNSAETFTAQILGGTGQQSGAQAQIGSSLDDNAIVKVQTPALLRVDFTQIDPFQTASDTFTVRARVTNSGEAQVDDTGLLRLIQDSKYSFVGTNSIQAFSEGQTIEWQLKAPDTATVADTFVVQIFQVPKEKNTLLSAATEALTDTAVIQTLDIDLFIQNWRVANPPGATDNILSTKQRFDLEATLSVSENIDSVRTDLDLSAANGYSLTPTFQSSVFLDNPNDQEWILWTVEATNLPHASPFPIGVRVRGWDKGSLVTDTRDTVAVVAVARAFIDIDNFKISNPNNATQVSIGQAFELSALVLNTGVAQVEGPAVLRLDLGNSGFETSDSLRQTFLPGTAVTWDLTVPAAATIGGKTISVMLDSIPDDENTNNTAEHDPQQLTKTLNVEIIDVGTIAIDTLRITAPAGATDGVLSADQQFTVEAEVQFSRARNIQAEIVFPAGSGFRVIGGGGNRFQDITSQGPEATVQWTVQAPVNPFSGLIKVKVTGTDASNPNQTISADPDSMLTTVVNKAQLTFNAFISSPPSAQDKELSFGQVFTVTAQLQNSGAGLSGLDSVKITLPAPYTTNDPLVKSIAPFPGGQATWIITAPNQTTPILDIVVELQPLSLDENTNQPPTVNATDVIISVTTAPIGLRTTLLTDRKKGTAVRGAKNVSIFGLQFDNDSDLIINIEKVNLSVQNSAGDSLAPNAFLSGLSVVDYLNSNTVFGPAPVLTAADRIELSFSPAIMVPPNQNISIDFQVDLLDQSEVSAFQFVLDSPQDEIMAIDADGNRVGIEDGTGNPISSLTSGVSVLINADLQSSFFNYPNPFGYSTRKQTFFSYNLAQDSDITIRVYTLLGEMVWSRSFAATDPQGKAGNHDKDIMWEGKNDKGQKVLNGVYVAVLSTNSGKATTKIAITR